MALWQKRLNAVFQVERLQKIQQILAVKKSVSVIELSDVLNVSEITIRRDFEKLESEGFLKRTHGGAVLNYIPDHPSSQPEPFHPGHALFKDVQIPKISAELGSLCANIVENYDVVFLGRSSSNIAMVEHIKEKTDIVVVTNSLEIMVAMSQDKLNRVILTGGEVDFNRLMLRSEQHKLVFPVITFNKAFIHAQGIHFENGITVNDYEEVKVYEKLKQCTAGEIVIVVEGVLFGKSALHKLDDLSNIRAIVTDSRIPDDYKNALYRQGVRIYQKFDL